jgi:hypothetical protein
VKKPITLAIAILVACSVWLFAEKRDVGHGMYLVTSFDFAKYPACQPGRNRSCILAIRFYDADTDKELSEVKTNATMIGTQRIVAKVDGAIPHRAYAVTVYLDGAGSRSEGPRGRTTELREPASGN